MWAGSCDRSKSPTIMVSSSTPSPSVCGAVAGGTSGAGESRILRNCASAAGLAEKMSEPLPFPLDESVRTDFERVFTTVLATDSQELTRFANTPLQESPRGNISRRHLAGEV